MKWTSRLVHKYMILFVGLVLGALLVNGAIDIYFVDRENRDALAKVQAEKAQSASQRLEQFFQEIERQIGWTTYPQWSLATADQRRFDYGRLLKQVPAISELAQIDSTGQEHMRISRLAMNVIGSNANRSSEPFFAAVMAKKIFYGPVEFRKDSEPYMMMAVAGIGRTPSITVADINLKLILDLITQVKVGTTGYAYVVDANGRLIAHPDISLVLRNTDLSRLPQVAAAIRADDTDGVVDKTYVANVDGVRVLSAHAKIASLGWTVFVELPRQEALSPVYDAATRTGILLLLGILLASLAAAFLSGRLVTPIRAMQQGAARFGSGELDHRLDIKTGDELETLAESFNSMAGQLRESYADLERKVADRTQALSDALERQTATTEVLSVISRSTSNLQPVLDTIAQTAGRLCNADWAVVRRIVDGQPREIAAHGATLEFIEFMKRQPIEPGPHSAAGRALLERRTIHIDDVLVDREFTWHESQRIGQFRTVLSVPLLRQGSIVGVITMMRTRVEPFSQQQIDLVSTFADQAVIAIENVRLFEEVQARTQDLTVALERQTATSEVLTVISQSTANLQPVFDTIVTTAAKLCEAEHTVVFLLQGGLFHLGAANQVTPEIIDYIKANPAPVDRGSIVGRVALARDIVHIDDIAADPDLSVANAARAGKMRTALGVPLLRDGEVVGAITVFRAEVKPFTKSQIDLITTFADQAVIAIENTRLFEEVQARTLDLTMALERQTATSEVLTVISQSTANLQPVFDTIVATAARLCQAESATFIRLLPDGSNHSVAAIGVSDAVREFQLANPLPQMDRGSVVGRALIDRKIVHIHDVLADPEFTALDRQKVDGRRTCLGVPLIRNNEALGVIFLFRKKVEPFTDKQIELVATFADQAVIAIENTRLFEEIQARTEELREALEFQTATSDVLKQMGRFSADLAPVLDTVTTTAARLCQADLAFVFLLKGGLFHLAAANRVSPEFVDYLRANPFPIDRGTTSGRVALAKSTVHIHDVGADRDYTMDQSRGIGQMRTSLGVPLLRDGEVVGTIVLARNIVKPFAQNQIDLITTFADQAAIAIENTRLFEEVQARTGDLTEALEYQTATSDVLKQMGRLNFDLTPVLQTVVGTAARLCEAERAYILLLGGDGKYHLAAANQVEGAFAEYLKHNPLTVDRGTVTGRVVLDRKTVQVTDVSADPEYTLRESTDLGRQRTSLGVPLLREGSVIGVIVLARDVVKPFALRQIDLVTTFADQAVIAIENVRLFRELEEKNKQLAIASQHKSQFLANMSHELRTPLNAILGYSEMMVDGLYGEMGDKAKGVLERVLTNGKHLLGLINDVLDLSKIEAGQLKLAIDDFRLADVVNAVVAATESLAKAKGLALHAHIGPALPVGRGDSRRLTQVLLNLVGNAIKFTDQGSVEIRASHQDGNFEVAVVDTGPGIPPEHQARIFDEFQQVDTSSTRKKGGTGLGLSISRKFVELHGGRITVHSKIGAGSTFRVVWPTMAQTGGETV